MARQQCALCCASTIGETWNPTVQSWGGGEGGGRMGTNNTLEMSVTKKALLL